MSIRGLGKTVVGVDGWNAGSCWRATVSGARLSIPHDVCETQANANTWPFVCDACDIPIAIWC
ncbi:MAG: hypothetical protein AB7I79_05580 [Rhizobiaceae bacterium]